MSTPLCACISFSPRLLFSCRSGSSQAVKRTALQAELQELEEERRRVDELLTLRRSQFQLLIHTVLDFQRTVEESML